jgi:lipoyl-dependent peroxiredoxin
MAELQRSANAVWRGDSRNGNGKISAPSGVLQDVPYTWLARFENSPGTNPEELIAAAHAACFSMAFASALSKKGFVPDQLETKALLTMEKEDIGWTVKKIHLEVAGKVPNIDQNTYQEAAEDARKNCPISRLLSPGLTQITVDARLG